MKRLSKGAILILRCGLPLVAAVLIYCAASLSSMDTYDAARRYMRTYSILEHALMALLLETGGALLFDIAQRQL